MLRDVKGTGIRGQNARIWSQSLYVCKTGCIQGCNTCGTLCPSAFVSGTVQWFSNLAGSPGIPTTAIEWPVAWMIVEWLSRTGSHCDWAYSWVSAEPVLAGHVEIHACDLGNYEGRAVTHYPESPVPDSSIKMNFMQRSLWVKGICWEIRWEHRIWSKQFVSVFYLVLVYADSLSTVAYFQAYICKLDTQKGTAIESTVDV